MKLSKIVIEFSQIQKDAIVWVKGEIPKNYPGRVIKGLPYTTKIGLEAQVL